MAATLAIPGQRAGNSPSVSQPWLSWASSSEHARKPLPMEWWQAILLGILQGITEFLPISSSGHLVLVQQFFQLTRDDATAAMFFDGMLHFGTTLAVLWFLLRTRSQAHFFANPSSGCCPANATWPGCVPVSPWFQENKKSLEHTKHPNPITQGLGWLQWLWLLGWASLPAALTVVWLNHHIRDSFLSVPMVATAWVLLGGLLWLTDRLPGGAVGLYQLRWYHALVIGFGQALSAVFRGLSRSGMTVSVALLLGVERSAALRFSLAMSIVANLGLTFLGVLHLGQKASRADWLTEDFLAKTLLATAVSAVVAYLTLAPLVHLVRHCRLRCFSYYLWLVGLLAWVSYAGRSS